MELSLFDGPQLSAITSKHNLELGQVGWLLQRLFVSAPYTSQPTQTLCLGDRKAPSTEL